MHLAKSSIFLHGIHNQSTKSLPKLKAEGKRKWVAFTWSTTIRKSWLELEWLTLFLMAFQVYISSMTQNTRNIDLVYFRPWLKYSTSDGFSFHFQNSKTTIWVFISKTTTKWATKVKNTICSWLWASFSFVPSHIYLCWVHSVVEAKNREDPEEVGKLCQIGRGRSW